MAAGRQGTEAVHFTAYICTESIHINQIEDKERETGNGVSF